MRTPPLLFLLTTALLLGCRPNSGPPVSGATNRTAAPFEGNFYIKGNPGCPVVLSNGFYGGATPYNFCGVIDGSGRYATRAIATNTWELVVTNQQWTFIVQVDGSSVWLESRDPTNRVELKRK